MDAISALQQGRYACVIERDGILLSARCGIGVKPLLQTYDRNPDDLRDAAVADRVIGKAAAMLLAVGGVRSVYGQVMSEAARQFLASRGIAYRYGESVLRIENRTRDGLCPIEQSVLDLSDPYEGLCAIREAIRRLMAPSCAKAAPASHFPRTK